MLPKNVKLKRFFNNLANKKEEISELCDFNQETFSNMINKMIENSDLISDILVSKKTRHN